MVGNGKRFDVNTFLKEQPQKRRDMLKLLVNIDLDEAERAEEAAKATKLARFREKEDAAARFEPVKGYSRIEAARPLLSTADLIAELDKANAHNQNRKDAMNDIEASKQSIERIRAANAQKQASIEALKLQIATLETEIAKNKEAIFSENASIETNQQYLDGTNDIDVEPIKAKMSGIEEENERIRQAKEAAKLDAASIDAEKAHNEAVAAVAEAREAKLSIIRANPLPIEGLEFDPDDSSKLLYRGHPLESASTGEQAIIALKLAEFTHDGSLKWMHFDAHSLDPVNRQMVIEWLRGRGYQALIEKPADTFAQMSLTFEVC